MEISQILKRTASAIKRRCRDLKIPKPKRVKNRFWTDEELNTLKDLWFKGYQPVIIAEELNRHSRQITSMLERQNYFGQAPLKYTKQR